MCETPPPSGCSSPPPPRFTVSSAQCLFALQMVDRPWAVSLGGPGVEGSPRLPSGDREDGSHLCGVWTGRLWQAHPVGTFPASHWLSRGPVEGRGVASSPEARALLQAGNDLEAPVLLGMSSRARSQIFWP